LGNWVIDSSIRLTSFVLLDKEQTRYPHPFKVNVMQRQTLGRAFSLPTLPIHAWLNRVGFPRSYTGKFCLVAFLANAVPLLAVSLYVGMNPALLSPQVLFLVVLGSSVLGGLLATFALGGLLQPIYNAHHTLKAYLDGDAVPPMPLLSTKAHKVEDEAGALTQNLHYALAMFEAHQYQSQWDNPRDFLTGLLNRRAAEEQLKFMARTMQTTPFVMCIARVELYTLPTINEQYGYLVGDQVLWRVARTVTQQLRGTDWVARWGGHTLLLALQADVEGTAHALKRIQAEIERNPLEISNHTIHVKIKTEHTAITGGESVETMVERLEEGSAKAHQ
jgi:diguanylate cyclase (GGDEF)-like protein